MNLLTITLCILLKTTVILAAIRASTYTTPTTNRLKILTTPASPPPSIHSHLYSYKYNTDTGIQAQEAGRLYNVADQEALKVRGSYSYSDNEGNIFDVSYIADENGFQPKGAHLPTVPPSLIKALQYIAEHPEKNGE